MLLVCGMAGDDGSDFEGCAHGCARGGSGGAASICNRTSWLALRFALWRMCECTSAIGIFSLTSRHGRWSWQNQLSLGALARLSTPLGTRHLHLRLGLRLSLRIRLSLCLGLSKTHSTHGDDTLGGEFGRRLRRTLLARLERLSRLCCPPQRSSRPRLRR